MNMIYTIAEAVAQYADVGVRKAGRPALKLICLGNLAGILIALASAATNTAVYGVQNVGIARMISACCSLSASLWSSSPERNCLPATALW